MNTTDVYGILGLLHIIGFLLLLIVVKIIMKRKIPATKLMEIYIVCFLMAVGMLSTILLFTNESLSAQFLSGDIVSLVGATVGEIIGLAIGFLIVDFIILTVGRWVYKRINK